MNKNRNNTLGVWLMCLLSGIAMTSYAQTPGTWVQKQDFGDTISTNGTVGVERCGAISFSLGNKGYIGTGLKGSNTRLQDFWEYDPETDTWTQKANFGGLARAFASGFSIGDKGYVGCGDENSAAHTSTDFWEYDAASNIWTRKADFAGVPRRGAVGFSVGTKGYMGTGRYAGPDHFKDIWEYDPLTDAWTQKADLTGNSRAFAAVFTIGSKAYIGTGRDDVGFVKDFWEFDPLANNWTQKADFGGDGRYGAVGLSIGMYGYTGTGASASSGLSTDFWEYNPVANTWTKKANFGGASRFLAVAFSIGNKGYIGTGQTNDTYPNYVNAKDLWEFTPEAIWTGVTDNNWEIGTNWQDGIVPQNTTNVTIPIAARYPIIGSKALSNNLTIDPDAVLTVAAGESLTVNGKFLNSSGITGLVIKSDATGTGSLIYSHDTVAATIERYVPGDWTTANSGRHLISSPVSGQAVSSFATSGTGNGFEFYGWNEPANLWISYLSDTFNSWNNGDNFNAGQGYMVSYQLDQTKTFSGNITVNSIPKTNLSMSNTVADYSWHLLGIPFSSSLIWNDGNWALNHVAGIAKIWNTTAKSYTDILPNGVIPVSQGFMISVNSTANSLIIPVSARTHNTSNYDPTNNKHIRFVASEQGGGSLQESNIVINTSSSTGFDFAYDSRFLAGDAPQFYSISGNEMLSTKSLPSASGDIVIPFGFVKNQSDNFQIELKETIAGQALYLTDLKTDSIQNMIQKPVYSFSSVEGDNPARFIIEFQHLFASAPKESNKDTFNIYQRNGTVNITLSSAIDAEILVSNMLGQVVLQGKTSKNFITNLDASKLQNGVYIVTLSSQNRIESKKIVVRN